jgi:uncharacterized small protein (DUF1192 family)
MGRDSVRRQGRARRRSMPREEEETPRKRPRFDPLPLEGMSREEMEAYIAALEVEIARVKATIAARESHRGAAEALFRKTAGLE